MRWLDTLAKKARPDDGKTLADRMAEAYEASSRGDYTRALEIWGPLAQAGVARAQNNVGACFTEGLGVERDPKLAAQWLALAAAAGDRVGQRNCASLYFKGEGVKQDYARALELYRAAAEQDDGPAQDMVSWMLLEGEVAAPDYIAARHYAERAAGHGVAAAMTRLGMIFHNALGVERDPAAAVQWWGRGAERGDADGQAMLGAALHLGASAKRDPVEALVWLLRARAGGSPLADQFFAAVRGALTPAQIAEAERRAAAPLPEPGAMIIGTAGHIDHGKTSLVRALTGVDTDRFKEEKARGISIDLGFAYLPAPGGAVLGFVDVPGHEKFVHNMLAGATGIDFVLLVIAADDGVMPQTREHLAIVDLLGIGRGVVALSKIDLATPQQQANVLTAIGQLLQGTGVEGAEVVPVSTLSGDGVEALREKLFDAARTMTARATGERFRLAVDRSFTLPGAGTVVTGTVLSGAVATGDHVTISPSGLPARVRSIHAQNQPTEQGVAGQRCALNLAGERVSKDAIGRGDVVLDPALHAPTDRIDADLRLLAGEQKPVTQWMPARLHHGATEVGARIVLLGDAPIAPGSEATVQIVLDRPIAAASGDRFVLRDTTAQRTIGGGKFLDLRAPARKRRTSERLAQLQAHAIYDPERALADLLDIAPRYVDLTAFARDRALADAQIADICERLSIIKAAAGDRVFALSAPVWLEFKRGLMAALQSFHADNPDISGIGLERLRMQLSPRLPAPAFLSLLQVLVRSKEIALDGAWVRLAGHEVRLTPQDEKIWSKVAPLLGGAERFRPPRVRDISTLLVQREPDIRRLLKLVGRMGKADEVAHDHFFLRETVAEMVGIVVDLGATSANGQFTAAQFRDRVENGRKVAIQILEFFDRHGVTLRRGDLRRINKHRLDLFRRAEEPAGREQTDSGRDSSPVGRPDFKSGRGREPVLGGFDSLSLPPR